MPTTFMASAVSVVDVPDFSALDTTSVLLRLRLGAKSPIAAACAVSGILLTIVSDVTATLYRQQTAVMGFIDLPVLEATTGAAAKVVVVYDLDTSGLTPGFYTLVFTFSALGSDGETRVFKPARNLCVLAAGAPD